jgi:hypothetical protein
MPRRPTTREISRIEVAKITGPTDTTLPLSKEAIKEQVKSI